MAFFNRASSVVTKEELQKPFTYDPSRLGYRPRYPEEEAQRARLRSELQAGRVDLVGEARRRQEGAASAGSTASAP